MALVSNSSPWSWSRRFWSFTSLTEGEIHTSGEFFSLYDVPQDRWISGKDCCLLPFHHCKLTTHVTLRLARLLRTTWQHTQLWFLKAKEDLHRRQQKRSDVSEFLETPLNINPPFKKISPTAVCKKLLQLASHIMQWLWGVVVALYHSRIGPYIPSCITHRPLPTHQISFKSEEPVDRRTDVWKDGQTSRPALLGVNLKMGRLNKIRVSVVVLIVAAKVMRINRMETDWPGRGPTVTLP